MHFIKYLKWTYKGHNLAILTQIGKINESFLYSNVFIRYERYFMIG